ncbi:MAG: hypothetical protein K2Y23_08770 [Cyanobacteria bacterium]|nr:hypothetical protein [Cyanobacteriota bacterium]
MTAARLAVVAPILAASWAAFNGLLYAADTGRRYRAESGWFVFASVLLIVASCAITRGMQQSSTEIAPDRHIRNISLIGLLLGAALLYFPTISIGLLSDDFSLLARARTGMLADPGWEFLRPFPLGIWRILDAPWLLHALNIGLHGFNAWLTSLLAIRLGLPQRLALLAGALFLVNPASVEAVVWAAGVFDALLTTLSLTACIVLTTASSSMMTTITIAALSAAALMTKETAVMLPVMLTIVAVASPHTTLRRAALPIAVSLALVLLYVPIRMMAGFAGAPPVAAAGFSAYDLKEMLSRPFGTLGLPFHIDFVKSHSWVPFVFMLLWPALLAWSAIQWSRHRKDAMQILGCAAWILASVAPLTTMLFIADDLQNARYVYMASVAWSIVPVVLVRAFRLSRQLIVIAPLIALFLFATSAHQSAWTDAARERDRVLAAYRESGLSCSPEGARGLPDHVRGAYVFRNGFADAVESMAVPAARNAACVLVWDGTRFTPD